MIVNFWLAKLSAYHNAPRYYATLEEYQATEALYFRLATRRQSVILCARFQHGKRARGAAPLQRPMSVGEAAELAG
jgi:UDP-N-acetylmuramyl tripeptide synthase